MTLRISNDVKATYHLIVSNVYEKQNNAKHTRNVILYPLFHAPGYDASNGVLGME